MADNGVQPCPSPNLFNSTEGIEKSGKETLRSGSKASTSSPSPSPTRLWRPGAQRNVRNQWSRLLSGKDKWKSAVSKGRSIATNIVNVHLSRRYMPEMDFSGALEDMPRIKELACEKLAQEQKLYCSMLLASYKDLVDIVSQMFKCCNSMRCFPKGLTNTGDENDLGDGGGVPVFSSWPIPFFEKLAIELGNMFMLELQLKKLLVELLVSMNCEDEEPTAKKGEGLCWPHELHSGLLYELDICNLNSGDDGQFLETISSFKCSSSLTKKSLPFERQEVIQLALVAWLSDTNINMRRVEEIFAMVEKEMQIKLS